MIAEGKYQARPVGHQFGVADTGSEQVAVTFEIFGDADHSGSRITWYGYFTERAWSFTLKALRTCGWDGNSLDKIGKLDAEVELVIEHEDDNRGQKKAKVKWINSPGGGGVKNPMTPSQLADLAQRMKAKEAGLDQPSNGGGGSMWDEPPPPTDDDLPF